MNRRALVFATLVGVVLQLAMVIAGHLIPAVKGGFAFGGMGISLVAGALYARMSGNDWGGSIGFGAVAGAVCAFVGIAASVLLKDVPTSLLLLGTVSSAITGAIGGAVGRAVCPKG
jgi:hypothetical protein